MWYDEREKIHIPKIKPFISFIGDPDNPPTITGNDTASSMSQGGGAALSTFQSATVAVDADYFIASNIIFEVLIIYHLGKICLKLPYKIVLLWKTNL